jgi:hypothetical protein
VATVTKPLRWATVDSGVSVGSMSKTVLTDGTLFYCDKCDYTGQTYGQVRGHTGYHSGKRKGRGPTKQTVEVADKNIEVALGLIVEAVNEIRKSLESNNGTSALVGAKQLENVTRQRDEALDRAKAAEKKFAAVKSLFS